MTWAAASAVFLTITWSAQIAFEAVSGPAALAVGALAATAFFSMQFNKINRTGRVFLVLMLVLSIATAFFHEQPIDALARAVASGLMLVAFIAALSTLRTAAASSDLLTRCGRHLLAHPPNRAYLTLNVGSMLAATVLLFGVIHLFGAMVAQVSFDQRAGRRAMLAVMRGYAMMPVWSPIALPFGLVSAYYPAVDWLTILPMSLAALIAIALVGLAADRIDFPDVEQLRPPRVGGRELTDLAQLSALVLGLMVLVGGTAWAAGWTTIRAAIILVPLASAVWLAIGLAQHGSKFARAGQVMGRLGECIVAERSILAVMGGAGFCGVLLGALAPTDELTAALHSVSLSAWAAPAVVVALFMLLGQVGFSPTLTFIILAVAVPDPMAIGLAAPVFHATLLAIWGLASIGTPFSVPAMVAARLFNDTPAGVVYGWSPLYLVAAPLGVALVLGIIAAFGG